jgi:hypothetical protein
VNAADPAALIMVRPEGSYRVAEFFEPHDLSKLSAAFALAWNYLKAGADLDGDAETIREVIARKILSSASDDTMTAAALANDAIRYARQFSAMKRRAELRSTRAA